MRDKCVTIIREGRGILLPDAVKRRTRRKVRAPDGKVTTVTTTVKVYGPKTKK